jgi:hypothetical protein
VGSRVPHPFAGFGEGWEQALTAPTNARLIHPRGDARPEISRQARKGAGSLHPQNDQIGAPLHSKFAEQVGDVELHGTLADEELAGNLIVGKVVEKQVEHFAFAAGGITFVPRGQF